MDVSQQRGGPARIFVRKPRKKQDFPKKGDIMFIGGVVCLEELSNPTLPIQIKPE